MEIELDPNITPFDLNSTLNCGQVFRWTKSNHHWTGIIDETIFQITQVKNKINFQTIPEDSKESSVTTYFRLDDDLPYIVSHINKDEIIENALNQLYGMRIVRQDPWECLISFICATFANIPRIKLMIQKLCQHFGRKIRVKDLTFYGFPRKDALAQASINKLLECNLGYRAKYIKKVAQIIREEQINLTNLQKTSYMEANNSLQSLPGVGHKVADCILLFSLDKLEAFPIDVRIKRILQSHYGHHLKTQKQIKSLTPRIYSEFSAFGRKYFGKYAGYAQEYLYAYFSPNTRKCNII